MFITNLDNIDVVDNVGKCIFNCTSLKDLLKNYEKSLYNWVLRYIYTPLGGIHTRFLNIFLIMLFYILINEMTNKVFFWALIIAFLFNVEVFLKAKLKEYNVKINIFFIFFIKM